MPFKKNNVQSSNTKNILINGYFKESSCPYDLLESFLIFEDSPYIKNMQMVQNAFYNHNIESVEDKTFIASFYKSGDHQLKNHDFYENYINTDNIYFHRPEFFEVLHFVKPINHDI